MDFSGEWVNTKNSVLELTQVDNRITGTFDSGVSDGGQPILAPIVGWANGDRVSFTATYEVYGTVVAWVGQVRGEPGNPVIDAHFLHESEIPDGQEAEWLWASTKTGSDQFAKR